MCFPSSSSLFSPFTSLVPFLSLSFAQRGDPPPLFLSPSSSSSSRFLSLLFLLQGEEGKKETESPLSSFSFLPSSFLRSFSFGAVRKGRGKAGRGEAYALVSLAAIGQAEKEGGATLPARTHEQTPGRDQGITKSPTNMARLQSRSAPPGRIPLFPP